MKLEQLLEAIDEFLSIPGVAITAIDTNFNILGTNEAARNIFSKIHQNNNGFAGRKCYEAYRKSSKPCAECPTAKIISEQKPFMETVETYNSLLGRYFVVSAKPLYDDDKKTIIGALEVAHDVTDIVKSKAAIIKAEKLIAVGSYTAGIVHDINNKLIQVSGPILMANVAIQEGRYDEANKHLQEAHDCVMESSSWLEQLMSYSRQEQHTREPVDMEAVASKAAESFRQKCARLGIGLKTEMQQVPSFDGYSRNLERVCINMLSNAVESFEGYNAENKQITVRCYHQDGHVYTEFEDNGCGIELLDQLKIFEIGYTTKAKGHGFGLAPCRIIVEEHHSGKVHVDSTPRKGTKFTIRIPDATTLKRMRQDTWFTKR